MEITQDTSLKEFTGGLIKNGDRFASGNSDQIAIDTYYISTYIGDKTLDKLSVWGANSNGYVRQETFNNAVVNFLDGSTKKIQLKQGQVVQGEFASGEYKNENGALYVSQNDINNALIRKNSFGGNFSNWVDFKALNLNSDNATIINALQLHKGNQGGGNLHQSLTAGMTDAKTLFDFYYNNILKGKYYIQSSSRGIVNVEYQINDKLVFIAWGGIGTGNKTYVFRAIIGLNTEKDPQSNEITGYSFSVIEKYHQVICLDYVADAVKNLDSTIDGKINTALTTVYKVQGSAKTTDLITLQPKDVHKGDVWDIINEFKVDDVTYPAYTNVLVKVSNTAITYTNNKFSSSQIDPLGGMLNTSQIESNADKKYVSNIIYKEGNQIDLTTDGDKTLGSLTYTIGGTNKPISITANIKAIPKNTFEKGTGIDITQSGNKFTIGLNYKTTSNVDLTNEASASSIPYNTVHNGFYLSTTSDTPININMGNGRAEFDFDYNKAKKNLGLSSKADVSTVTLLESRVSALESLLSLG